MDNKKVFPRERKRHTARHVVSARYAALSPGGGGGREGNLSRLGQGYPIQDWKGGTPVSWMEYPQTWDGVPPPGPGMGYPPSAGWGSPLSGVPPHPPGPWMGIPTPLPAPGKGYPHQLDGVIPIGWMVYPSPPPGPGMGYPPVGWIGYPHL